MNDPRNDPRRDWLINVLSSAPIRNYQEARYKGEFLIELCDELEAKLDEFNQAEDNRAKTGE